MRILIFTPNYLPHTGGAELAVKHITDHLPADRFTCELITPRLDRSRPKKETVANVMVHRAGIGCRLDKALFLINGPRYARAVMRKRGADLLWGVMASYGGIAAAITKKRYPRIPFLLTLQEGTEESRLRRHTWGSELLYRVCVQPLYEMCFRYADRATAISSYLVERVRRHNPELTTSCVPNGVLVDALASVPHDNRIQKWRNRIAESPDDVVIVSTSRLVEKNGVDTLIDALQHLPARVRVAVAGDGPLRERLEERARQLGVRDRCVLLGNIDQREVPYLLHAADIFARPSRSEGLGNSFLEAMAAGVPVVATTVGGIPDFITHRETGMLCEPEAPKELARTIIELMEAPDLRTALTTNAHRLVRRRYDWGIIAKQMGEVFDELGR